MRITVSPIPSPSKEIPAPSNKPSPIKRCPRRDPVPLRPAVASSVVLHSPQSARGLMPPSRCVNAPRMKQTTKMLRRRFWRARERGEEMGKRRKRPKKRARKPGLYQKPHISANCNLSHRKMSTDKAKEEADAKAVAKTLQ